MEKHEFDKLELLSYSAGDCSEIKATAIQAHVKNCSLCRSYLDLLLTEKKDFLAQHPFDTVVHQKATLSRAEMALQSKNDKTRKSLFPFSSRTYFSLAASLVLFVSLGYFIALKNPIQENRIKGNVGMAVFVQDKNGTIETRSSAEYKTGEKIQCVYSCDNRNNFVLLSIDTTGNISTYYPFTGDTSIVLEKGQDLPLPNSIILDNYIGPETFISFFSEAPFSVFQVKQQLQNAFDKHELKNIRSHFGPHILCVPYSCKIIREEKQ
jgi:hypothetical protein